MLIKTSISAALLLAATSPALAASAPEGGSETVGYSDLNLASPAGMAAFESRIERAVRRACGAGHPGDLDTTAQVRQCRVAAYQSLAPRRDALLAAVNSPRTGGMAAGGTR